MAEISARSSVSSNHYRVPEKEGSFRKFRCASKVSNLFDAVVVQHYKVVTDEFDVF